MGANLTNSDSLTYSDDDFPGPVDPSGAAAMISHPAGAGPILRAWRRGRLAWRRALARAGAAVGRDRASAAVTLCVLSGFVAALGIDAETAMWAISVVASLFGTCSGLWIYLAGRCNCGRHQRSQV